MCVYVCACTHAHTHTAELLGHSTGAGKAVQGAVHGRIRVGIGPGWRCIEGIASIAPISYILDPNAPLDLLRFMSAGI